MQLLPFNTRQRNKKSVIHNKGQYQPNNIFTVEKLHIQYIFSSLLTVSAAVRLIPSPPARVLSRNTKMSFLKKRERERYFKRKNWKIKLASGKREGSLDTEQCLDLESFGYPDLIHVSLKHWKVCWVAKMKPWQSSSDLQINFCCPLILTDRQYNLKYLANVTEKYAMEVETSL